MSGRDSLTAELSRFVLRTNPMPSDMRNVGIRSLLNIIGCAFGGAHHEATECAYSVAREFAGAPTTTLIGRGKMVDALTGAYLNGLAASAHAFDDTHLATVVHPAAPVASALFALADRSALSGEAFLDAFIIGMELECRLAAGLLLEPARGQWGWYASGITGAIGAAGACARVLGLAEQNTQWAIGIAANQASGFRQTHGSMCTSFIPAHAARCGLHSALLAANGFTASGAALEGANGYLDVFTHAPHAAAITGGLGTDWEVAANTFKPYPCGIVIHPVLDACIDIATDPGFDISKVADVTLEVDPLCLTLCDNPVPSDSQQAQVSVQHWAAAALMHGRAGLAEGGNECVRDPGVIEVRNHVKATANHQVGRAGAMVTVTLDSGEQRTARVSDCIGSAARPMNDAQLDAKFAAQAAPLIGEETTATLIRTIRSVHEVGNMAAVLEACAPT
ncbi:MAG: MmgE/PrpD family protein [Chromatiales bacterium]|jgi:2-methylcitrate dehydratase PrpD|nr:MmgE/PrpD family protein [Chromatiales bacterium]